MMIAGNPETAASAAVFVSGIHSVMRRFRSRVRTPISQTRATITPDGFDSGHLRLILDTHLPTLKIQGAAAQLFNPG
jgi:hypothetical protein